MSSTTSTQRVFQPPPHLRGLFVGSGSDGMNEPAIAQAVMDLVPSNKSQNIKLVYIGTATYDMEGPRHRQTEQFVRLGCKVDALNIATRPFTREDKTLLDDTHILLVGGGNTLYAIDRWRLLGVDKKLYQAMTNSVVLTGGSAGAIWPFDGGHSDSADPDTWRTSMLTTSVEGDESSGAPKTDAECKSWEYIRVAGLGFLPGLVCPHHDKRQSNGILRANDFDEMLLRHNQEIGIGIDHWAALKVEGEYFSVISLPEKEGSLLPNGDFSPDRKGTPAIWIKNVKDGVVQKRLCPPSGRICELLCDPTEIIPDPRVALCREQNPADSSQPLVCIEDALRFCCKNDYLNSKIHGAPVTLIKRVIHEC